MSQALPVSQRGRWSRALLLPLVLGFAPFVPAGVSVAQPGQWTLATSWGPAATDRWAVHMILVPGDGAPDHSRILWFRGEAKPPTPGPNLFRGGEWGWQSGNESCSSFPSSSFVERPIGPSGVDIFCAGNATLPGGVVFLPGGTHTFTGAYGENNARLYTVGSGASAGTWPAPQPAQMTDWRWYPTATTLPDGRVLVAGGDRHPHVRAFGGRRNGVPQSAPEGDKVHRFAPVNDGAWEPAVTPAADLGARPMIREGHSFLEMRAVTGFDNAQFLFGGLGTGDGLARNDTWQLLRTNVPTASDYSYAWNELEIPGPIERFEHSAVSALGSAMIVYGGRDENGNAFDDAHSLRKVGTSYLWSSVTAASPPTARFGHAAIYEENTILIGGIPTPVQRMIVFGGIGAPGQTPTDANVYELRLNSPTSGTWSVMPVVDLGGDGSPSPRYGHTLTADPTLRSGQNGKLAYLFGGALGNSEFSPEFWMLQTFQDGTCDWVKRSPSGGPPARARHQAVLDLAPSGFGRMYLFGGETTVPADRKVYIIHPKTGGSWLPWAEMEDNLSGHSFVLDGVHTLSRVTEVYDPNNPTQPWQNYTNAPFCWDRSYPVNFVVPGGTGANGRVLTVSSAQTSWLDLPASGQLPAQGWQTGGASPGFNVEAGVQYAPGKIMVAGGTTTKTFNVANMNVWANSAAMQTRYHHNLVLLANGKVLAVGGTTIPTDTSFPPEQRPQIWDPAGNGGAGTWTLPGDLDIQDTARGYHSTAILLPDGRVLSSGGEDHPDQYLADIYCPPYLFKTNGAPAARPVITQAPTSIPAGKNFVINVASTTGITGVSLVRAGATTHGFDQNQRFVPLSFQVSGSTCLEVAAPPSLDHAPVGDYLLFVLGSPDRSDVPSLARWLRIDPPGVDAVPPAMVTDLAVESVGRQSLAVGWTASGDDGNAGTVQQFEVKYSTNPIHACNFDHVTTGVTVLPNGPGGTPHCVEFDLPSSCTPYYFSLRGTDDAGNKSFLSMTTGSTACSGNSVAICSEEGFFAQSGGGGGWTPENSLSLEGVDGLDLSALALPPVWDTGTLDVRLLARGPELATIGQAGLGFVDPPRGYRAVAARDEVWIGVESALPSLVDSSPRLGSSGESWSLDLGLSDPRQVLILETSGEQRTAAADGKGILVQRLDASGAWTTIAHVQPRRNPSLLAVPTGGAAPLRLLFRAEHTFHSIRRLSDASVVPVRQLALTSAVHSRWGEVADAVSAVDASASTLLGGESLVLRFASPEPPAAGSRALFLSLRGASGSLGAAADLSASAIAPSAAPQLSFAGAVANPTAGGADLSFSLPAAGHVRLRIYEIAGRVVSTVLNERVEAGRHMQRWSGMRDDGSKVASGVYLARMEFGDWRSERKIVLVGR